MTNNSAQTILDSLDTATRAAGPVDGFLAQRLVGAAAATSSAIAGDTLNSPPPPLPTTWAPTRDLPATDITNHISTAITSLRELATTLPRLTDVANALQSYVDRLTTPSTPSDAAVATTPLGSTGAATPTGDVGAETAQQRPASATPPTP